MDTIRADHLMKSFGPVTAVNDVSLAVREGEIFGFLGPNGAGKTTTTRILTGVIPLDAGSAAVLGHDISTEAVRAKQGFGVVPEISNAYTDLTAWQNLMLMGELYGLARAQAAIAPIAFLVVENGPQQIAAAEVRPQGLGNVQLGVGDLP